MALNYNLILFNKQNHIKCSLQLKNQRIRLKLGLLKNFYIRKFDFLKHINHKYRIVYDTLDCFD